MRIACRCFSVITTWAALSSCFLTELSAQSADVAYEAGINAYFAGRAHQAESYLSEAIERNSRDPRAYYFRALSLLRLGHCDLAQGDFLTGATLEAQNPNRYAIGAALERIQGHQRLQLEEYRRKARLSTAVSSSSAPTPPNSTFREGEGEVIRDKKFVPLDELLRPEGPRAIAVEPPAEPAVPPQDDAPAVRPEAPPATPPADTPENNPFADDGGAAPAPSSPPPTAPATPPQEAPQPETPPAVEDENPFGG